MQSEIRGTYNNLEGLILGDLFTLSSTKPSSRWRYLDGSTEECYVLNLPLQKMEYCLDSESTTIRNTAGIACSSCRQGSSRHARVSGLHTTIWTRSCGGPADAFKFLCKPSFAKHSKPPSAATGTGSEKGRYSMGRPYHLPRLWLPAVESDGIVVDVLQASNTQTRFRFALQFSITTATSFLPRWFFVSLSACWKSGEAMAECQYLESVRSCTMQWSGIRANINSNKMFGNVLQRFGSMVDVGVVVVACMRPHQIMRFSSVFHDQPTSYMIWNTRLARDDIRSGAHTNILFIFSKWRFLHADWMVV